MSRFFAALMLASLCISSAPLSAADTSDQATVAGSVVETLGETLDQYYLDRGTASAYRQALIEAAQSGQTDGLGGEALAKALTSLLQKSHADAHLAVYSPGNGIFGKQDESGEPPLPENAYEASGWIAPGVAYLRPFAFFGRAGDVKRMQAFVDEHAAARALILDLRHHAGGEVAEIDVLAADLFDKPTDLALMRSRTAGWDRFEPAADTEQLFVTRRDRDYVEQTHRAVPRDGGARMGGIPVYVLTSKRTASAGEHLAMILKRTGRAVLIGEATYGAGNYGEEVELSGGFKVFVPYGETVDPDTGKGWEGTGVAPNVAIEAKQALNVALQRLGVPTLAETYPKIGEVGGAGVLAPNR
jgi:hypothetical protein